MAMCTHAGVVSQEECLWCQMQAESDKRVAAAEAERELLAEAEEAAIMLETLDQRAYADPLRAAIRCYRTAKGLQ